MSSQGRGYAKLPPLMLGRVSAVQEKCVRSASASALESGKIGGTGVASLPALASLKRAHPGDQSYLQQEFLLLSLLILLESILILYQC